MTTETQETAAWEAMTPGARRLMEAARLKAGAEQNGINHWLDALLERHAPMAEAMARDLNPELLAKFVQQKLSEGEGGTLLLPETVEAEAVRRTESRGRAKASEHDVAAVILTHAGYEIGDETAAPENPSVPQQSKTNQTGGLSWRPRSMRPTPALDTFGRDMTRTAATGKLAPVVGRDTETGLVIETLCRRTKRNPALVGPAGIGKTAIVEGLASRIACGEVPEMLRRARLISLSQSAVVAGAKHAGELNERLQAILSEAAQDGIVLFIDELHSFMEFADALKPTLARGDVACIGATTDDEYRRFIEADKALERRFQPLRVQPLSPEQTLLVLNSLVDTLAAQRNIAIAPATLRHIVTLAKRFMPNRQFPDKAVDVMEQCIAHALAEGKSEVSAIDVDAVVQRLVGMPLAAETRLSALSDALAGAALLAPGDAAALESRLQVTMSGMDLHPERPNGVVMLLNEAAENAEPLGATLARAVYGAEERVVRIDFGRMTEEHDVSMLLGSPPGYVGYSGRLAIHEVAQMPWCVLLCADLHACHPAIRATLAQALASGQLTDSTGSRIYLSDATVIITANVDSLSRSVMGFRRNDADDAAAPGDEHLRASAARELGEDLVDACGLLCAPIPDAADGPARHERLLSEFGARYLREGLRLEWDESFHVWLAENTERRHSARDCERLVEEQLAPLLLSYLPRIANAAPDCLTVAADGERLLILRHNHPGPGVGLTAAVRVN